MTTLRVLTWNVLHRIHAENWAEHPVRRYPDERVRQAALVAHVRARFDAGLDVACLQEASGDLVGALNSALNDVAEIFAFRYPRVPRFRGPPPPPGARLVDPTEALVTLVARGRGAGPGEAAAFADDAGKGYLAVESAGYLLVNSHVTFGDKAPGQLARLASVAGRFPGPCVVTGDFNAPRETIAGGLPPVFTPALAPEGSPPTRPRTASSKSQDIDHVFVRGARPGPAEVTDVAGLSDHNPVACELHLP